MAVLRNFLLLVAGIITLNMLLLASFAVSNARDESRKRREIRELESLWGHRRGARDRSRSGAQRVAGVVLVTIVLGATTALASPQGRGVLTSVLSIVSRGLQGQPEEQAPPEVDGERSLPSASGSNSRNQVSGGSPGEHDGTRPVPSPPTQGSAEQPGGNDSPGGPVAPPTPTAVTAVAMSSSQIRVDWFGVPKETGYRVERLKEGGADWAWVAWVGENVTATVDTELDAGTTYYYRVFATDPAAGDSSPSSVASATTGIDPASPTTVTAVATSESQVELSWTDVGNETGYRVERMVVGDDWLTIATTGVDVIWFTDAELEPGTTYHYRVYATNPGGDSPPSEVVVATTSAAPLIEP